VRLSTPLGTYTAANHEWALDFVHDAVACGRSIRVLNVIDAYTRESLAMEVDTSFAGLRQLVPEPVRSQEDHRRLASRLQRTEAP
jgi:hypothetical protein